MTTWMCNFWACIQLAYILMLIMTFQLSNISCDSVKHYSTPARAISLNCNAMVMTASPILVLKRKKY